MFEPIRRKLLFSYLGVLAGILLVFSFAVRSAFIRSLKYNQKEDLELLGNAAKAVGDFRGGSLNQTDARAAQKLHEREQAIEWFDSGKNKVGSSGEYYLEIPLPAQDPIQEGQIQTGKVLGKDGLYFNVLAMTIPVYLDSDNKVLTGYVRASQSLRQSELEVDRLDWGLMMGSLVALVFSGAGGLWLMQQAMEPIEQSFNQLKQFTADASHELRSPLMAISSNAKVALKYPDGMREGDRNKFESIHSASGQMSQLTQDLLFLARTEKIPKHQQTPLEVTGLLEELIQLYHSQAEDKGIELMLTCQHGLMICGDKNQLNRLFTNLLVNALHHTSRGGKVSIEGKGFMTQAIIQVKDTGSGISKDQISKVFNRFWRAESSRRDQDRSGLGLAIAQAIANAHQGSISVTSVVNQGSCFTVKLPMLSLKKNSVSELSAKA